MRDQYTRVLSKYIPASAVDQIVDWVISYGVHLKITKDRSTKLGDFRPVIGANRGHIITINYNLNQYAFLITLVHEIAHFSTWNKHQTKVKPHGKEWKQAFKEHMLPFLHSSVFPEDVLKDVRSYMNNPAASSCVDEGLMRTLRQFDNEYTLVLKDLPEQALFRLKTGRVFKKGEQRRKYFRCEELSTKKHYLINPMAEVEPLSDAG